MTYQNIDSWATTLRLQLYKNLPHSPADIDFHWGNTPPPPNESRNWIDLLPVGVLQFRRNTRRTLTTTTSVEIRDRESISKREPCQSNTGYILMAPNYLFTTPTHSPATANLPILSIRESTQTTRCLFLGISLQISFDTVTSSLTTRFLEIRECSFTYPNTNTTKTLYWSIFLVELHYTANPLVSSHPHNNSLNAHHHHRRGSGA